RFQAETGDAGHLDGRHELVLLRPAAVRTADEDRTVGLLGQRRAAGGLHARRFEHGPLGAVRRLLLPRRLLGGELLLVSLALREDRLHALLPGVLLGGHALLVLIAGIHPALVLGGEAGV